MTNPELGMDLLQPEVLEEFTSALWDLVPVSYSDISEMAAELFECDIRIIKTNESSAYLITEESFGCPQTPTLSPLVIVEYSRTIENEYKESYLVPITEKRISKIQTQSASIQIAEEMLVLMKGLGSSSSNLPLEMFKIATQYKFLVEDSQKTKILPGFKRLKQRSEVYMLQALKMLKSSCEDGSKSHESKDKLTPVLSQTSQATATSTSSPKIRHCELCKHNEALFKLHKKHYICHICLENYKNDLRCLDNGVEASYYKCPVSRCKFIFSKNAFDSRDYLSSKILANQSGKTSFPLIFKQHKMQYF